MTRKAKQRYDSVNIKATLDENGFLSDTPVVARIGLQVYQTPDGERREFRPASEVFAWDALESFRGKPITHGHVEVNSDNAKDVMVGACTGSAYRQWDDDDYGVGVVCPLTIHVREAIQAAQDGEASQISVGYTTIDIESPGWGNNKTGEYFFTNERPNVKMDELPDAADWVQFDALQTSIRVNHVALVFRGRAGIAKLNLDSEQDFPYDDDVKLTITKEDSFMTVKIKLDGSQEHEVHEAVAAHISTLAASVATIQGKHDSLEAERDALKAKVDSIPQLIEEAMQKAKADGESHAALVTVASEIGVKCDGLNAKEIKIAYIKQATGRDVSDKADSYIETAFDFAKESDKMISQRLNVQGGKNDSEQEQPVVIKDPQSRFRK